VAVSKRGAEVLRGEAEAGPLSRVARPERSRRGGRAQPSATAGPGDEALFEALRRLRRELADERRVPPYVVFSDATLHELARLRPRTREAFLTVKGVGEWKCAQYGVRFLAAIAAGAA
jgi:ATP-dependent DNA helicase RecQ